MKKITTIIFALIVSANSYAQFFKYLQYDTISLYPGSAKVYICLDENDNHYVSISKPNGGYVTKSSGSSYTILKNNNATIANLGGKICSDKKGNIYTTGLDINGKTIIAKWDGTQWQNLGNLYLPYQLNCDSKGNLYVLCPDTITSKSYYSPFSEIHKWNGTTWTKLNFGLMRTYSWDYPINNIAADTLGNIYFAVYTDTMNGHGSIYKYDGSNFSLVGNKSSVNNTYGVIQSTENGTIYTVNDSLAMGPSLNNINYSNLCTWSGTNWSRVAGAKYSFYSNMSMLNTIATIGIDKKNNLYVEVIADSLLGPTTKTYGYYPAFSKWDGTAWIDYSDTTSFAPPSPADFIYEINVKSNGDMILNYRDYILYKSPNKPVDVKNLSLCNMFQFYPNPTNNTLTINLQNAIANNTSFKLFNAIGALVMSDKLINKNTTLNIQHFPTGIYFLEVTDDGNTQRVKVIKN